MATTQRDTYLNQHLVNCGGVNNTLPDELIADNELSDANNLIPGTAGQMNLVKRPGYNSYLVGVANQSVGTLYSGNLNKYYTTYYAGTAKDFTICDLDDGAELASHGDPPTWSQQATWATLGVRDFHAGGDASHNLYTTDGATFGAWSGPPATVHIIASYNNFIFGTLMSTANTLYWSALSNAVSTWPTANSLVFNLSPQYDFPTALCVYKDVLVLFTMRNFFHIYGYDELGMRVVYSNRDSGCIGPHARLATPFGLIWWDPTKGIVISKDGYTVDTPMLRKLRKTWDTVKPYQTTKTHAIWRPDLNCARFFAATAAQDKYILRIDYYPENDRFYLSSLSTFPSGSHCALSQVTTGFTASATINEYMASGIAVYKETIASAQDITTTLSTYAETKRFAMGSPIMRKTCQNVLLTTKLASEGVMSYQCYLDNATSAETAISPTVASGVVDTLIGVNRSHRKIKHRVGDSLNQRTEYYSLIETGVVTEVL